ncbi:class I SAM-dependent methyltransferase [Actinokineospora cianjurensis]|uniref:Trans-aconitate methyltransferase n=1 Tax=Actinokineospora cianjurensis TaxID=585224 RepID=A0A421B5D6_9PSEU|nr:class I SAM-dependent methyltransferase [Actinokineospora cianjurensis]RLK59503.1 trans-aconitate methyltransferase [Actinokineospora cianjurensis]
MELGFGGEVADFYDRYRRGYPTEVVDGVVDAFALTGDDVVVDLGCGTGQLAVPLAARVKAVVGVDPEPDMLAHAAAHGAKNATWVVGKDIDLPALRAATGPVAAVTVGQALHWMDHELLFGEIASTVRVGGGIAIVTNGTPLWLQDSDWSQTLREVLEQWFTTRLVATCGTDDASQERYLTAMTAAGLTVDKSTVTYTGELTLPEIVGGIYSALPVHRLPSQENRKFLECRIDRAFQGQATFTEEVRVTTLIGRVTGT